MANNIDFRAFELRNLWAEASIQLNGVVKTIKLTTRTFSMLGPDGEGYFGRCSASVLGKNTEFIGDESNPNRIYLGNPSDIEQETNGVINYTLGQRLRVLRPGYSGELNISPTGFGTSMNNAKNHVAVNIGQRPATNNPTTPSDAQSQGTSQSASPASVAQSLDIVPQGEFNSS
ncbi:hypothetical protein GQX73_g8315 [Xylaria multiplex]|uniref:Uncharacterized protein n=1 Tax=Xylaria multiplex TaxID=323545 RepID=A0A7C8IJN0_9PEZI|nr:hypothetical protein GQX73_g8315 [Xylaria multiplex]